MDGEGLSAAALADLAGVTEAEVRRLVRLGVLAGRDAAGPFTASDAQKVRLAQACERAGLPLDGIASAIRDGRLSFGFLEAAPYRRWAVRSARTYRQVSQDTGIPLDLLGGILEAMGFARMAPDEPIREDELEVVPLLELARSIGSLDRGLVRIGRAYAQGLRRVVAVEKEDYTARFARLVRESGADRWTARERAARLATELLPLSTACSWPATAASRSWCGPRTWSRTSRTSWRRPGERSSREHGGEPVKSLGDGVMVRFRDPAGAVLAALRMVEELPAAGLPPAHAGVAAGPVAQGGDYFGRTVNLAARIAAHAGPRQVLVSGSVADSGAPPGVAFTGVGEVRLEGFSRPVRLLEARRA